MSPGAISSRRRTSPARCCSALGFEPLGVGSDSRFCLGDQLLLSLRELRQLVYDRVLRTLEVVRPGVEARFDLLLRGGEGLAELVHCSP